MIVYLANKIRFREDILSNRIEEIVHDSFKGVLGKTVGASELASWKNSLRHMDTVLEDAGIPDYHGVALVFEKPGVTPICPRSFGAISLPQQTAIECPPYLTT
jgi:uncharacterized protein